jgi:hypothetical protein
MASQYLSREVSKSISRKACLPSVVVQVSELLLQGYCALFCDWMPIDSVVRFDVEGLQVLLEGNRFWLLFELDQIEEEDIGFESRFRFPEFPEVVRIVSCLFLSLFRPISVSQNNGNPDGVGIRSEAHLRCDPLNLSEGNRFLSRCPKEWQMKVISCLL